MKRLVPLLLCIAGLGLAGCGSLAAEPTATPTATPTPAPSATPQPTATLEPTSTATQKPRPKELEISFDPNPVEPYQVDGEWDWPFTFSVYNPNDFPVEVVSFGISLFCPTDPYSCPYTGQEFADWFNDCGEGSSTIPPRGTACDAEYWISNDEALQSDEELDYILYYRDQEGDIYSALSEVLTLLKE
jgi:hypothetical protein